MANICIDIDLEEFENYEIIDEVCYRIEKKYFNKTQIENILKSINEYYNDDNKKEEKNIILPIKTLDDVKKIEHLLTIWDQYNHFEFEEILKKKY